MKQFKALNTIIHEGKTYAPGATIEVDEKTQAWLEDNNCIGPVGEIETAPGGNDEAAALADLTVADLKTVAEAEEVNLDGITKKADIIAAIETKRAGN